MNRLVLLIAFSLFTFLSCKKTGIILPSVSTDKIGVVTSHSAECNGTVQNDGNTKLTARGVCWSKNHNPSINDFVNKEAVHIGPYVSVIYKLTPATVYYFRAFASNSKGTSYGEEKTFITLDQ
jgi:hypothetical protein